MTRIVFMTRILFAVTLAAASVWAQSRPVLRDPGRDTNQPPVRAADTAQYPVKAGTHILLAVLSTSSSKNAQPGDWVYLKTTFPVFANGKVVIPEGSYVTGTVTSASPAGKMRGKGQLFLRFDELTLPNGVAREFKAAIAGLDGNAPGKLNKEEGSITADGAPDGQAIGTGAIGGAALGAVAARGAPMLGAGIGAGAGAAVALFGVLLSRGPEAKLEQGTRIQMVLDRDLTYSDVELDDQWSSSSSRQPIPDQPRAPQNQQTQPARSPIGIPGLGGMGLPFPRF